MEKSEANTKIAKILGVEGPFCDCEWAPLDVGDGICRDCEKRVLPDFCGNPRWAAEFRQYTMRQKWCFNIVLVYREPLFGAIVTYRDLLDPRLVRFNGHSEEEASSMACLMAWDAAAGESPRGVAR